MNDYPIKNKNFAGVFINIPKEHCEIKEQMGMTWAGIIKLGIDSIEKNKQYYKLVETIDKLARENESLRKFIKNADKKDLSSDGDIE